MTLSIESSLVTHTACYFYPRLSSGRKHPAIHKAKPLSIFFFFFQTIYSQLCSQDTAQATSEAIASHHPRESLKTSLAHFVSSDSSHSTEHHILWYSYCKMKSWWVQKSPDISCSGTLGSKKPALSTDSDTVNCGGDPEQSGLQYVQGLGWFLMVILSCTVRWYFSKCLLIFTYSSF